MPQSFPVAFQRLFSVSHFRIAFGKAFSSIKMRRFILAKLMSRTIALESRTLRDLKEKFQLQKSQEPGFFFEWQQNLPVISEWEHQRLDRIYAIYANFNEDSVLEFGVTGGLEAG